jgi:hypothetical protein
MAFEKIRRTRAGGDAPRVRISPLGTMGFSGACVERYIGDAGYVEFYYDRGNRAIGLKFLTQATPQARAMRPRRKGSQVQVSAMGFLSAFGIALKESRSFVPELDELSGFLVVRLDETEFNFGDR